MTEGRSEIVDWTHPDLADYYAARTPAGLAGTEPESDPDGPVLDEEDVRPSGFAEWFAGSQTLLPALLLLPGSQMYRLPLRVGAYAISLYAFALWWLDRAARKEGKHPAERFLLLVMVVLTASIAHPDTV